jgi:hypothetical protein
MVDLIITAAIVLGLLAIGAGISEYYHHRIDRARRDTTRPLDQPDNVDIPEFVRCPIEPHPISGDTLHRWFAPQPAILLDAQKRAGRKIWS